MVTVPEPATLRAMVRQGTDNLKLDRLEFQTSFLTARGEGDVDRGITMTGSVDLAAFHERFRDWIDLGEIELSGRGKLDGRYQRHGEDYQAQATAAFEKLRIEGLPVLEKVERELLDRRRHSPGPRVILGAARWIRECVAPRRQRSRRA